MKKSQKGSALIVAIIAGALGLLAGLGGGYVLRDQNLAYIPTDLQLGVGGAPVLEPIGTAESIISIWPQRSQDMAREMIVIYGQPDEITDSHLIWYNRG